MSRRKRIRLRDSEAITTTSSRAGHDGEPPVFMPARDLADPDDKSRNLESVQNVNCTRIMWLYTHKLLDARQFDAGKRLARDWELSLIMPFASLVMVGAGGSGDLHPSEVKEEAMKRYGNAVKALRPYHWPIVELVVIKEISVEKSAAMMRIHQYAAKDRLNTALHILADHYGIPGESAHAA